MQSNTFDAFTKAIATATSRRQALRRIGGILGGAALAGLFPGLALADNSDCAHFCNSVFDPGPDRGKCKSDAAHHTGLCYTCGPASPGGTKPICCPQNPDGTCTRYGSATCCGSSATCLGGSCCATANVCGSTCLAAPCDASQCLTCDPPSGTCVSTCLSGQTCQNGTCTSGNTCHTATCPTGCTSKGCGNCLKSCTTNSDCTGGICATDADGVSKYCTDGSGTFTSCDVGFDCDCLVAEFCSSSLVCLTATN